ncbi:MAG: energy-coupling factor transporter transmembrane protein EcfT [Chloroflexi bacterium]|nr:energy-coupling factor transporter transmembrane protein EcfT [Chloroflexota bacterium]
MSKLVYVIAASVLIINSFNLVKQFSLLAISAAIALLLTGQSPQRYWAGVKLVLALAVSLGITGALLIDKPGPVVVATPLRNFTYRELTDGFTMGLQFVSLAFLALSFVYTTHPRDLSQAVSKWGMSYRYTHGMVLALVFLPILLAEAGNVEKAHRIRDFGATMNPLQRRLQSLRHLMVTLVARSLRRAETLACAMDVKGFGMAPHRTYFKEVEWWRPGQVFAVLSVGATIAFALLFNTG